MKRVVSDFVINPAWFPHGMSYMITRLYTSWAIDARPVAPDQVIEALSKLCKEPVLFIIPFAECVKALNGFMEAPVERVVDDEGAPSFSEQMHAIYLRNREAPIVKVHFKGFHH